ncbi:uncharacterized protein [Amphiura filiformis]|uniref:uncharacterized protein n=1 Tax=Amphiura filiformis TaxID=82378 RepID=UPI003B227465
MRVPFHFPRFTPASLSAAAYLSSPRVRRLSETEIHSSAFSKRLTFSPPPARRRRVTNFSIEGILGKQEEQCEDDEEDMKVLVVDTNSEPMSPSLSISEKDEKTIGSPISDHPHHHHEDEDEQRDSENNPMTRFSWLQCTRYKPPRLPRAKRKEGAKKRKLGRNPRVPFSPAQVATLEQKFRCTHYLSSIDVAELSQALNLSENRVKIWFQNRRARERRDKEAADKGEVSSSIRQPTSSLSLTSPIPSMSLHTSSSASSVIVSTSPSMLGLSTIPRIPSSPVDISAFTPVSYDLKAAAAAAVTAAALSSLHSHPSPTNL